MPEDPDPKDGSPANNDTLPEGAVSAVDAQTLRDSHAAELLSLNEQLTKAGEEGAKALAAKEAAEAKVRSFGCLILIPDKISASGMLGVTNVASGNNFS